MKTNVALGDIITVKGTMATYNGRQIGAGSTAEITGHDSSYDYAEMTIEEALAAEDNTNVIVTGTVVKIGTAYDSYYKNISVYIADDNGKQLYLYRLSGNVTVGQIIKVKGAMATYNGNRQIAGGTFEEVGTHECSKWTEATCKTPATCVVCGATTGELADHDYVDGTCSVCGATESTGGEVVAPTTVTASKTVAELITEYGWTSSTTKQSFNLDDNVTVKINGGSNTGKAYNGDHIRIYATDSPAGTITISVSEGYELVSIKISTLTGTYAFLYVDGTTTDISNVETAVSGSSVILNSVKNGSDGKQVRVTAFEVVYKAIGGTTEPEEPEHTHAGTEVLGQAATCCAYGWKNYYKCSDETCAKLFADAECTAEITLDAWKTGNGKIAATGEHTYEDGCTAEKPDEGGDETVEVPDPTTYTFSSYTAGTQYESGEVHKLDDNVTITTTDCHFTTQLRIYSSSTNNGYAIIESSFAISTFAMNAGYKKDTLIIYGSDDGATWTQVGSITTTTTSYKDYSCELNGSYKYLKLDVSGSSQIRIASMTLTFAE